MNRLVEGLAPVVTFVVGVGFGVVYHEDIAALGWVELGPVQAQAVSEEEPADQTEALMSQASESLGPRLLVPALGGPLPLVQSTTLDDASIQQDLHRGAVVLPLGSSFGEPGNTVITAHSSGLGDYGPYSQAFAKLGRLKIGDRFTVVTETARYTYHVYDTDIVWPHEVDQLPHDQRSTVTLVTCWPLWTDWQRLLVHAELVLEEDG